MNLNHFRRLGGTFSLRTLVVIIPAVFGALLFVYAQSYRRAIEIDRHNSITKECILAIEGAGGVVDVWISRSKLSWRWYKDEIVIQQVSFSAVGMFSKDSHPFSRIQRSEQLFKSLCRIPDPYRLDVTLTDFCNADLEKLQGARITGLYADRSMLTDEPIAGECLPELSSLSVQQTNVGDSFIRWTSSRGKIVFAMLSGTKITDEAVPILASNKHLGVVSIDNTSLSENALTALRKRGILK